MPFNTTTNYLMTKKSISIITFARQLNNVTAMLYGPGQLDTVGVPIPCFGRLKRLTIYDSNTSQSIDAAVDIELGDLISVQAEYVSTSFTISVMKNLTTTELSISGIGGYRAVWATIVVELVDPVIQ